MSEIGSHCEHETGLFTVAAWMWAGEGEHSLDFYDFPQTIHILHYRGSMRGRHRPQEQTANYLEIESALAALRDPCADTRKWAARSIEDARENLSVGHPQLEICAAALAEMVYDPEWSVRVQAVGVLGQIGCRLPDGELRRQVIERLCSALLDVHGMVRASAARALDAFNWQPGRDEIAASYWVTKRLWQMCVAIGPAAARPLALALTEWDWTARRGAAEALGRIGGSCAVSALMGALNDEIPAVAEAAALALGRLGDPVAAPALLDHLDGLAEFGVRALGQIAEKANPATVSAVFLQPLEALLSAEETNPRVNAVNGLAAVGSRRGETSLQRQAVQMLSARIDDPDAQVRRSVLRGIEAIGAHAQEDGLRGEICALQLRAGNDPDEKVRQAAVNGIGHIGRRIGDLSIRHQLADEIRATFDAPDEQVWAILADLSMPEVVPGLEG